MKHRSLAAGLTAILLCSFCLFLITVVSAAPGDLDTTFAGTGKVLVGFGSTNDFGKSLAMQPDGKIVVAGTIAVNNVFAGDFGVLRYNPDGSLDTSFGFEGKVTTAAGTLFGPAVATAVRMQTDGKIVVAGYAEETFPSKYRFLIVRYNSDGTLDTSFDSDGRVISSFGDAYAHAMVIQADGKIVVVGIDETGTHSRFMVARYNIDGSADTFFGTQGSVSTSIGSSTDIPYAVTILAGKIIVAGLSSNGSNY